MNWRKLNIFRRRKKLDNKSSRYGVDLVAQDYPNSIISEQFRTNLMFSQVRCIMVTFDSPNEGKLTISVNLATVLAKENKKVCVVDCDMRRPTVERTFGLKNKAGLSTYLSDQIRASVQKTKIKNLYAVTSGLIPLNPSELMANNRMSKLIQELKPKFNIVILDVSSIMASRVYGVIMIILQNIAVKTSV